MKRIFTIVSLAIMMSLGLFAKDTVYVPMDVPPAEGNLNTAIETAKNAGTLSNTVFKLVPYGIYISTGSIVIPPGEVLEIVADPPGTTQASAPPQLMWTASGSVTVDYMFECQGDIILKNIWVRYARTDGTQTGTTIQIVDDSLANLSGKGEVGKFEGVIFDYAPSPPNAGGAITVAAKKFKGSFKNCYFKNCTDKHLRYYGRAISFPYNTTGYKIDSCYFDNCTFANMGYVYMQESNEWSENVHFNHCTFFNVMVFTLESGWWYKMSVTNSIFVNTYMFGDIPSQTGTSDPNGGTIRIDSVANIPFTVTFTDQERRILFANNSYSLDSWLTDWMANSPYAQYCHQNRLDDQIPVPQAMLSPNTLKFFDSVDNTGNKIFPYMNKSDLYDGVDPGFILPPTNLDSLKPFLNCKWDTNCDHNWAFQPNDGYNQTWPLPENMAYTNTTLKTAAMGGFPLGDLYHWWPSQYATWKLQAAAEWSTISRRLETPVSIDEQAYSIPAEYKLAQNYPNPFNPTTKIEYTLPKSGNISISVFNVLGQKVATLFSGVQSAGNHAVTFDASKLSSGVYLYRLQAENCTLTKKLILTK